MASCNLCGVEMVGGCAANGCPHRPTPPLAHGPDHAQARALALQVVPPTAYHAQFSVEQRAAYNLAQAYIAATSTFATSTLAHGPDVVEEIWARLNPPSEGNSPWDVVARQYPWVDKFARALASSPSGEAVACVKRLAYWANLWAEQGSDETLTRDIVDGDERVALASLATLREERDALLADKARLDWLERDHNAKVYPSQCFGDFGVRVMHEDGIGFAESGKVRDAIDAARAAHQGTEP